MTYCQSLVPLMFSTLLTAIDITADDYYWFNIVTDLEACGCQLAIDIDYSNKSNCPGTQLIVCPLEEGKMSQVWRWEGSMLKNWQNGLVWEVVNGSNGLIQLARATSRWDQRFNVYRGNEHIYLDIKRFNLKRVVEVHCDGKPYSGANVTSGLITEDTDCDGNNQEFKFVEVEVKDDDE